MNLKDLIRKKLIEIYSSELAENKEIAKSIREQALDVEMKQEDKWDTRRIEASYLAGAQAKRVEEIQRDLNLISNLELKEKTDKIASVYSLITIESGGKINEYFLSPAHSSRNIIVGSQKIQAISIYSPLGREIIGYLEGDVFEIETPQRLKEYEIKSVL